MAFVLQVREDNQLVYQHEFDGPLELGRQQNGEAGPYRVLSVADGPRLVLAKLNESRIARRQLRIDLQPDGRLELTNQSGSVPVRLLGGMVLSPKTSCVVSLPVVMALANRVVSLEAIDQAACLNRLDEATRPPSLRADERRAGKSATPLPTSVEAEQLVRALQATMDVFQSASTAGELFATAVRGAVELVGFDAARLLLRRGDAWDEAHALHAEGADCAAFSGHVLSQVLQHSRTFWDPHVAASPASDSLRPVQAVIAAPVLNPQGEVIAVLYGDRRLDDRPAEQRPITRLEAQLIELLAGGVASGLAKLMHEDAARRMRLQFEQFFTPELVRELEAQPDLLEGREAEVSVLFCDIRGFSRISERIGTAVTFAWINDVLGALSECVLNWRGVLVDYIGDELMAMWGAPQKQTEHAELACQAALDMLGRLPELNRRWEAELGEPLAIGIGVNSGQVRAGNSGSRRKFKYGPLGNTVNLASRVQGATKHLKIPFLVTGETIKGVPESFPRRRIGAVQVVNIAGHVTLWEISSPSEDAWRHTYGRYDEALAAFEQGEFRQAAKLLSDLLNKSPDDGPSLALLKRVAAAMVDGPEGSHPVWTLAGK